MACPVLLPRPAALPCPALPCPGMSLGLKPKRNRFGWFGRHRRRERKKEKSSIDRR